MTDGQVLEFSHATKRFGVLTAVDDLSARIEPGAVTAFLGPNGAGKTTSLRMLLGQIRPSSGTATIGGVPHSELRHPLRTIGSVLEEAVYRPRRTAPRQLTIAAKANGIPLSRVDEVLALVGLQNETETRIGAYSLGMRQRLSVAGALLGDPGALVLDEPANGLDPEGIRWMRLLMRRLADEGRTVLVSSHVLSEIEQIADNVLVLSKGRLVYADSIGKLSDPTTGSVIVDAEDRAALTAALRDAGLSFDVLRSGLTVHNTDAAAVGAIAATAGLALTTLQQRGPSLEEVFLDLVHGRRDPLTGSIPVLTAADAGAADGSDGGAASEGSADVSDGGAASEGSTVGGGADGAPSAQGADEPATAEGDAPAAGLFGTATAAPVVAAAGAGVAGLFGSAPADAGTVAIPTTRREAAEFAAAQSAQDAERAEAEGTGEGAAEGEDSAGDAIAAESAAGEEAAAGEGADSEGDSEAPVDEGPEGSATEASETPADEVSEAPAGEAPEGAADQAGERSSDEAGASDEISERSSDEAESAAGATAAGPDVEGAQPESDDSDESHGSESDETGGDDTGEIEEADADDRGAEPTDENSAIAAGVALTAPIVADYTPGEPHADAAEAEGADDQQDGSGEGPDAPLAHAAEGTDEQGVALGSFETAALTIPSAATPVSFDELITGVPSAVQPNGETEGEDGESDAAPGDQVQDDAAQGDQAQGDEAPRDAVDDGGRDDAPTAATTVITTPPAEDEFVTPEPTTETTEIAGIEIFAALEEGRTQEIQVVLGDTPAEDDDLEDDVTQGEIHHDEDPRAAAVSASLAAAARAFFTDEAPSYTPGPTRDEDAEEQPSAEQHGDEQHGDEQHGDDGHGDDGHGDERRDGDRHDGDEHHHGEHHDGDQHHEHHGG
ncbi:ABC-type multidrug transport system, ATPase component [Microbacterium sp. 8M]|uniref:ATP-binding cassette domain-containing protein n=1 Tax=Microbacterium sp. 8M TaxID=2653153 RepID=UPI0012F3C538|nr:ATP-binding cassette domain-containing protein [Microbacterium sp. 8M]VXB57045.1 ABC-type multidrug transport system, ATPase component [Microbacterium sp. 8M]